jgi:hypothetical protein
MNDDLDIPSFLIISPEQRRQAWRDYGYRPKSRYLTAKQRRLKMRAIRKAARKRKRHEWR